MDGHDYKQLLSYIEQFSSEIDHGLQVDSTTRIKLLQATRKLATSLEDPTTLTSRVLVKQPVEELSIRIAADLRLFEHLCAHPSDEPKSLAHLTNKTGADALVLSRILRSLAAFGTVEEIPSKGFRLKPSASQLAEPSFASCFGKCQDFLNSAYGALPAELASTSYACPTDPQRTAIQRAYGVQDQDLFRILKDRPETANAFGMLMNTWGQHGSLLHEVYPVRDRLITGFDEKISPVMLVDVGGGWGQKAIAVKKAIPDLPGRLISQDLPHIIAPAPKSELCEITGHDFFSAQPIKNPRAFYIRQTLHNWNDDACIKILGNLKGAMKEGYTKLLLHEQVVPPQGASTWTVTQDFNMMALLSTCERTLEQWTDVIRQSGLKINEYFPAEDDVSESVIEIVI